MNAKTELPEGAGPPPTGCEWRHASTLEIGEEMFLGNHRIFGRNEQYFGEITDLDEKPKTINVSFRATHPQLLDQRSQARIRKDEWIAIRTSDS